MIMIPIIYYLWRTPSPTCNRKVDNETQTMDGHIELIPCPYVIDCKSLKSITDLSYKYIPTIFFTNSHMRLIIVFISHIYGIALLPLKLQ